MNNLELIISIGAWLLLPVALWMVAYFAGKIIMHYWVRSHLGDMPSAEELHELYEQYNDIVNYREPKKTTPPPDSKK